MAYKVLGQSAPAAATMTDMYTVPAATQTIGSTLSICNRSATATTYRIAIRPAGATLANQHYLAYDGPIIGNDTTALTLGFSLATTDVVSVYAAAATLTFGFYGYEI